MAMLCVCASACRLVVGKRVELLFCIRRYPDTPTESLSVVKALVIILLTSGENPTFITAENLRPQKFSALAMLLSTILALCTSTCLKYVALLESVQCDIKHRQVNKYYICLLYTSDAADE